MENPDHKEAENKSDQEFLEKMGIVGEVLPDPKQLPTEEEVQLQLRWQMIIARG